MKVIRIHNVTRLGDRIKELRNNSTNAEIYLWTFLRSRKLSGRKFRRQHGIGSYIVDFYCAGEKLIVELDGDVHDNPEQKRYDLRRDRYLKELGFKVLRIKNERVFCNVSQVLRLISAHFDVNVAGTPQSALGGQLPLKKGEH